MKKIFLIIMAKIAYNVGSLIGRGSSLPGKIALKIYPDILSKLVLPENIIGITGSNGKTSTAGMIDHVLKQNGFSVGYNFEGSNQVEGVATLLLRLSTLSGVVKKDVLVIEIDERYTRHVLKYITPKYFIVTNLYRDQLTRNGHPELIYSIIAENIRDDMHLIINTDDPLSSMLGLNRDNVTYFGLDKNNLSTPTNTSIYNDGIYCPNCKHKLIYDYYHFNHIGSYKCENCGHQKHLPQYNVTDLNLKEGYFVVNGSEKITISLQSFYNIYNLIAAFAAVNLLGMQYTDISASLNNYILNNGRIKQFEIGGKKGMMLLSKHENSISYDQSLSYISNQDEDCTVVIIVDAVSRKYFTSETSWLWDIDFENLNTDKVKKIILAGKYAYDLAVRFEYTGIAQDKIIIRPNLDEMMDAVKNQATGYIYVLTCFSDKDKFIGRLK